MIMVAMALAGLVVTLLTQAGDGAPKRPSPDSLLRLIDLDGLADLERGATCRQFSSSDPVGRGDDHGHFLALEGRRARLAEMDGPGVITRLWSANAAGRLKVWIDGEETPRIDAPFQEVYGGKYAPFAPPIAIHSGGGWISYFPIAYEKHCRVEVDELDDPHALYYQVQYKTWPAGTKIRSFTRELPAEEAEALKRVVAIWSDPEHAPPAPPIDEKERASARSALHVRRPDHELHFLHLPAGQRIASRRNALQLDGPATIDFLRIDVEQPTVEKLRGLVLEAWFDESVAPSVSVPVADLFAVGFGARKQPGLLLGWGDHGGYMRLPMPFQKSCAIGLSNLSREEADLFLEFSLEAGSPFGSTLHAEYVRVDPVGSDLYEIVRAREHGKFVGVNLTLQGVGDLWYLEGNEQFFVDGEAKPSILGTGTEDFFNGGWYWDSGPLTLPLHGLGVKEEWTTNRTTPWRHFLNDAVPFEKSLVAKIEHGSSNEVLDASYSSVALWYGESPHLVRRVSAEACRLPRRWVRRPKDALVAVDLEWSEASQETPVTFDSTSEEFRGCEFRLFQAFPVSHFERDQPRVKSEFALLRGREASATFPVEVGDRYRVRLGFAVDRGASPVEVAIDGKPLGTLDVLAARQAGEGMAPSSPEPPAPIGLAAGRHTLTLRRTGDAAAARAHLGLDSLALEPASEFVKAWWVAPPVECRPKGGAAAADAPATVELEPAEEAAFLERSFDPKAAGWKEIAHDSGQLDLNALVTPKAPIFAYVMTWLFTPDRRTTTVRLGSDDGVRVWLDGKAVFAHAIHRPLALDADRFELALEPGWHALLVKVKNDDGGFGVALRLCDPDGALKSATRRE
jgi:hypothetical protein